MIAFDDGRKEECLNCAACVRTCPVGIDIRKGLDAACINCAECIDACSGMMERKQKKSLINYSFGLHGEAGKILRQNVILITSIVLASFAFLIYLSMSRVSFDFTVMPNSAFAPRTGADGTVINSYILSLENRGEKDLDFAISAGGQEGNIRITPDRVTLAKGENRKVPVYVSFKDSARKRKAHNIDLVLESRGTANLKMQKKAYFMIPGAAE